MIEIYHKNSKVILNVLFVETKIYILFCSVCTIGIVYITNHLRKAKVILSYTASKNPNQTSLLNLPPSHTYYDCHGLNPFRGAVPKDILEGKSGEISSNTEYYVEVLWVKSSYSGRDL